MTTKQEIIDYIQLKMLFSGTLDNLECGQVKQLIQMIKNLKPKVNYLDWRDDRCGGV